MKWTPGTQNDDVVDARGKRPVGAGAKLTGGGIAVALVVIVVGRLFGIDISGLLGGGGGSAPQSQTQQQAPQQNEPSKGPDPDAELFDFIKFVMKDIQDTFATKFQAEGRAYQHAKLIIFTQAIDTGCGRSSAAIGPFYCPADHQAYIDLSFYKELRARFGAPGDFAQAYVLAHEIGHHLQNLMGTRSNDSVRIELQADCYAGVWGNSAQHKLLDEGDLEEALTAAAAIGDDRLQKQAGREVNPESFTHGSSAQRVKWFRRGFDTGRFEACDTFHAKDL